MRKKKEEVHFKTITPPPTYTQAHKCSHKRAQSLPGPDSIPEYWRDKASGSDKH